MLVLLCICRVLYRIWGWGEGTKWPVPFFFLLRVRQIDKAFSDIQLWNQVTDALGCYFYLLCSCMYSIYFHYDYRSSFLGRGQGCCFGGGGILIYPIFPLSLYETMLFGSLAYLHILWHTCEPLWYYIWVDEKTEWSFFFFVSQVITESVELSL